MKILSVFHIPKDAHSELSYTGGERRFIELAKKWSEMGNEVTIIGTKYAFHLSKQLKLTTKFHKYSFKSIFNNYEMNSLLCIFKIIRNIPVKNYDIILCPSENLFCVFVTYIISALLNLPIVGFVNLLDETEINFSSIWIHKKTELTGSFIRNIMGQLYYGFTTVSRNVILKKFDLLIPVSSHYKAILQKMGIDENKISRGVGAGINYSYIDSIKSRNIEYDVCYMGLLESRKGVFDLINIWNQIIKTELNAKLILMGTGSKKTILKLHENVQNKTSVIFAGFVETPHKYQILKSSKIFIFPSYKESFGQAILEAMACGIPVVAYDLPIYREWYGEDIVYASKGNIGELYTLAIKLLKKPILRKKIGENGKKRVKQFSWENIAKYEINLIRDIINDKITHKSNARR